MQLALAFLEPSPPARPSAAEVGLPLQPTELLVFGNARGGTPLMQSVQTIGIDLPLKVLDALAKAAAAAPQ
jgi:hypothetical protein